MKTRLNAATSTRLAASLFLALALTSTNAASITLPPPFYDANLFQGAIVTTPGTQTYSVDCFASCSGTVGLGQATGSFSSTETMSNVGPFAFVSSTDTLFQGQLGGGIQPSFAKLTYFFEIVTVGQNIRTPTAVLDFSAKGTISDSLAFTLDPGVSAVAAVDIFDQSSIYFSDQASYNFLGNSGEFSQNNDSASFNDSITVTVPTNTVIGIELLARVSLGGVFPDTISAFMDPIISLDSSDPSGLSLVLSQGVTQGLGAPTGATGVPEPSSLSLLGAGLAGLLATRLRCGRASRTGRRVSSLLPIRSVPEPSTLGTHARRGIFHRNCQRPKEISRHSIHLQEAR